MGPKCVSLKDITSWRCSQTFWMSCFPLIWFTSNILRQKEWMGSFRSVPKAPFHHPYHLGYNRWLTLCIIYYSSCSIDIFDGFMLFATDWFDVSGFYLRCQTPWGNLLRWFPVVRSCIFFFVKVERYLAFCKYMVIICCFFSSFFIYKCFIFVRHDAVHTLTRCAAIGHLPLAQSHQPDLHIFSICCGDSQWLFHPVHSVWHSSIQAASPSSRTSSSYVVEPTIPYM